MTFCHISPGETKKKKWPYPLTLTPGPWPNAYGESTKTVYSIATHIAKTLGVIENVKDYDYPKTAPAVEKELQKIFGNQTVDCRILLTPDGKISDLTIWKSTASPDLEKKACDLIRQSSPFDKNNYPSNLRYAISFPNGSNSKLIWWSEQTDTMPKRVD